MNDLQQHMRRFLESEIPTEERKSMNQEYKLHLEPGVSFLGILAARAVQLAESSPEWARLCAEYDIIGGADDG